MRGNYKSRIAALAAEVVRSRRFAPPPEPFVVWSDEAIPPEAIVAARKQGRPVFYWQWLGNRQAEFVEDKVGGHVVWSRPQDCPMEIKRFRVKWSAALETEELVETGRGEWMRPEALLEQLRKEQQ